MPFPTLFRPAAANADMQTFLPFASFATSGQVLDYRRLGKQRVEAFQLLVAIDDSWAINERARKGLASPVKGWRNHPAAIMWRGYGDALRGYMNTMIQEWVKRGYNNNMTLAPTSSNIQMPPWLGEPAFHASHRANLLRKDAAFYGKYGWIEDPAMPYVWPTLRVGVIGNTTDFDSVIPGSNPGPETIER